MDAACVKAGDDAAIFQVFSSLLANLNTLLTHGFEFNSGCFGFLDAFMDVGGGSSCVFKTRLQLELDIIDCKGRVPFLCVEG